MLELAAEVVYLVSDLTEPVDVIHQPTVNDGLQLRGERHAGTNDQLGRSRIARPLTLGRSPRAWSRVPAPGNQAKTLSAPRAEPWRSSSRGNVVAHGGRVCGSAPMGHASKVGMAQDLITLRASAMAPDQGYAKVCLAGTSAMPRNGPKRSTPQPSRG
jgi:hypothetical protein